MTNLPSSTEAYEKSQAQETFSLADALTAEGAVSLSSTAGMVLMACLFGRNLTHLHRCDADDHPEDPANGEFWKRHHRLDSILSNTLRFLPEHLRISFGGRDPNVLFLNVNIYAAVICLHQAAILNAERHQLGQDIIRASSDRCLKAAEEIVDLMKLFSQMDSANVSFVPFRSDEADTCKIHPFLSFCLYVAARVFTHAHIRQPSDDAARANLHFLLHTMQAHRQKNNLTESFIVQLVLELEAAGLPNPLILGRLPLKRAVSEALPLSLNAQLSKNQSDMGSRDDGCTATFSARPNAQPAFSAFPRHNAPRHSPATTIDSKYLERSPSQPPIQCFSVPLRDSRAPVQPMQGPGAPAPNQPILLSHGWGGAASGVEPYRMFDTEMSSEETGDPIGLSGHPTSTDSHRSSSHTSYTPPQEDPSADPVGHGNAPYFHHPQFSGFASSAAGFHSQQSTSNDYSMTGGWDLGPESMAVPMENQQWAPILESMAWTDTMGGWRPPPVSQTGA